MDYKIPIIEKIYEAYSALADGRVKLDGDKAYVTSSDYLKNYEISKTEDSYISNDNMTYFVGAIGYPILAVMMLKGELNYNAEVAKLFKNINWKKLNTENKNDYQKVANMILKEMAEKGIDVNFVKSETEKTYVEVKKLKMPYKKSRRFPPK